MATPDPTRRPPAVGKTLTVKVTPELYDDLLTLLRTGATASDAVRTAVRQAADIHRTAWAHRVCEPGTAPVLAAYSLTAAADWAPPTSGYDGEHGPAHPLVAPPPYPPADLADAER